MKCFDTFNDSYGSCFWFMNNPNEANCSPSEVPLIYNVGDGWLDDYMPDNLPFEEGTMVQMNWKFLIKGEKFGYSTLIQLHQNANGELKATVEKSEVICTE